MLLDESRKVLSNSCHDDFEDSEPIKDMKPSGSQRPLLHFAHRVQPPHHSPPNETPNCPPPHPKPTLFFLLSIQDQIMWKMNRGAVTETTWPPQQNHTRQIDIIRQPLWVIFLRKYFTRLPFFPPPALLLLSFFSLDSHLFFIAGSNKSQSAVSIVLGLVRLGRAGLGQDVLFLSPDSRESIWGHGSGVREWLGVERIGQGSLVYKLLPHALRTTVWLLFPVFKQGLGRREVAITLRATENLVFPASRHTGHIWSQATCFYNGT